MQASCAPGRIGGGGPGRQAAAWLRRYTPCLMAPALAGCSGGTGASAGPHSAGAAALWLFASLALVIAAGASFYIGRLRAQQRAQALQRAAQREQQALLTLLDGWFWRSGAQHQLLQLQPPAGAPASDWVRCPASGLALWQHFESALPGDDSGLRTRLQAQAAFSELPLRRIDDGSAWLLRAVPCFDDAGRFSGHVGGLRPRACGSDASALQALLASLDTPTLLAFSSASNASEASGGNSGGWQLQYSNPAAQRWLGAPEPLWAQVLAQLPQALREALASAPAAASGVSAGWLWRRFNRADAAGGEGLLLTQAAPTPAPTADASEMASFSFTVSHDLRAPIRVVEGFTRILKEDYGRLLDRVGNDHLDRVLTAAARMNHMIDALLTLARLSQQPLARQPVNLSQIASFVVDEMRRGAPERAAEVEIEPGLLTQGDPTLLRLVLENLLGNAWKYTARCKTANIVFASTQHEGRRAYVVRDNGAGFDMRSAERLFGLFQRLHSANDFPGTGVGLASVKRIVLRHGGEVWADAEPGRGAAFHFTLRD